jgi:hypothetical protein
VTEEAEVIWADVDGVIGMGEDAVEGDGNKFSRDDVEPISTEKAWPQEDVVDCEDERPRRERRVVVWRDLRIVAGVR